MKWDHDSLAWTLEARLAFAELGHLGAPLQRHWELGMGAPGPRGCSASLYSWDRGGEGKATCMCLSASRSRRTFQNQKLNPGEAIDLLSVLRCIDLWSVTI